MKIHTISSLVLALLAAGCSDTMDRPSADVGGQRGMGGAPGTGGSAGAGQDTTLRTFGPDDSNLVYSGRILFEPGKPPRFSAPGVSISARFKGVSVDAMLQDYASTANYFDAVIDGDYANARKVRPNPAGGITEIAKGLPYGEHDITLVKRTESSAGQVDFRGFVFGGDILPARERPTRRLEILGDSISAGSGNEALDGSSQCQEDYGRPYSNANKSYGPMLARALDAEYHLTAVSGIGAMRNYNCGDANTMPKVYDRVFMEAANSPPWDPTQFVPDALLVALGTNDFSPDSCMNPPLNERFDAEHYAAFLADLENFLRTLRGYYPAAEMFLLSSPMLHDGWPDSTYTSDTDHRASLTTVAETINQDPGHTGAGKVHLLLADFSTTRIAGRGCGTHPSAFEHGIMAGTDSTKPADTAPAELYLNPIKQVMGW